jgi:glucan phosphoethanolaminetransferase (alkaline phosphatase superfamily)
MSEAVIERHAGVKIWQRIGGLLALSAVVYVLLLLPDFLLRLSGYTLDGSDRPKAFVIVAVVALALTSIASRKVRLSVLAFLVVNQIIWCGVAAYFGRALGPEQLLLAPYEMNDTVGGALAEWRTLLPWTGAVLGLGAVLALLQWPQLEGWVWRSRISGWVLLAGALAAATFWSLHKRIEVAFPAVRTPSIYGPFQAAVSTARLMSTDVHASIGMELRDQDVKAVPAAAADEPVTVVVIMGESINAYRLSLFGFESDTTPGLARWRKSPPAGFTLMSKIGISGGTATFGSVPTFLRMAYLPVQAQKYGQNLFDLADRQGFKSWFLSVQHPQFLDAAGGAKNAVRVETEKGNEVELDKIHDDLLVKWAREVPGDPARRFVFIHQRVNHAGYTPHCSHAPDGMYIFSDPTGTTLGVRRAAYDNGLRCWDRNVTSVVEPFLAAHGAVYVFITADHSELMGEGGLWGHGMADIRSAMVPMLLLTNRPTSPVADMFRSLSPPTTYRLAQTVARAMGLEVKTPGISAKRFYLNSTMPFALAGFMEVDRLTDTGFRVSTFARNGKLLNAKEIALPELATAIVSSDKALMSDAAGARTGAPPAADVAPR